MDGKSRTKKLYLASGNEHGLAWQLTVNISAKKPRWGGTFYLAETTNPHPQRTIFLVGGVAKSWEWQLSISISAKQEKQWGNFYFKAGKAGTPTLDPSPNEKKRKYGEGPGEGTKYKGVERNYGENIK